MDRTLFFRVLLLLGLAWLAACGSSEELTGVADGPDWTGVVSSAPLADAPQEGETLVWITVNPPGQGLSVGAVIQPDTEIALRVGQGFAPGDANDLQPGADVRLWVGPTEYFSTPPMFDAVRIEVW